MQWCRLILPFLGIVLEKELSYGLQMTFQLIEKAQLRIAIPGWWRPWPGVSCALCEWSSNFWGVWTWTLVVKEAWKRWQDDRVIFFKGAPLTGNLTLEAKHDFSHAPACYLREPRSSCELYIEGRDEPLPWSEGDVQSKGNLQERKYFYAISTLAVQIAFCFIMTSPIRQIL